MNSKIYSVCIVRTDTNKEGERIKFLHHSKENAQKRAEKLNEINARDPYNVYRYVVREEAISD